MIYEFFCGLIREKSGKLPERKIRKLVEMYCQAAIYMTVKWALGGMEESSEELADLMIAAMPAQLYDLYVDLGIL